MEKNNEQKSPIYIIDSEKSQIVFDTDFIWIDDEGFLCVDLTKQNFGLKIKYEKVTKIMREVGRKRQVGLLKIDKENINEMGDDNVAEKRDD